MSVAVVDEVGQLMQVDRMDGSPPMAPDLAEALTATFEEVAAAEVPAGLQRPEHGSFRVPPASHGTRLRVLVSHFIARWRRR